MSVSLITALLTMCLEGNYICERNMIKPTQKFYESGKACYIEGVFYQSCPQLKYQK